MVHLGAFERIAKLTPSRDLYVSFLIQGCSFLKVVPTKFPSALAVTYKWLSENNEKIASTILKEYSTFFANYKGHKPLKEQTKQEHIGELRTLFKFCRILNAPVDWVKHIPEPDLLMGEKAILTGCSTTLRLLFECKHHYS